jgi:crotonobetainyl-CoA:carnitine CoA-transferase CaiB-like acyl-CoA transferase
MAAAILGDLGADVIKVEERDRGDPLRGLRHLTRVGLLGSERNVNFENINRNKRGITSDLRKHEGREVVYKLIEKSDVLVHNFRPQAARRLGLDYETVSRLNPRLVYAQASAWGPKGPESERGGLDIGAQARVGLMYITGMADAPPPQRFPDGFCDVQAAQWLALGIVAALQARERLGRGQMVHGSLFGATIALATWPVTYTLHHGVDPPRYDRGAARRNALYAFYKCADGEWIQLLMLQAWRYWSAFCEVVNVRELEKDSRFDTSDAMMEHGQELMQLLDQIFATKPRAEWMKLFAERDLPFAPIQRPSDLVNDPQAIANDYIMEFDHPTYGREKVVGFPCHFSETPPSLRRPCPEIGQHTEEVLVELGYTWDDIARLKERQVI